jgi:hypothetical protein
MSYSVFDEPVVHPPQQPKSNNTQGFILGLLIVGLLGFFFASHAGFIEIPKNGGESVVVVPTIEPEDDDQQQPDASKPPVGETYIVRIVESKMSDEDGWLSDQIQNQKFWQVKVKGELGMGLETLDPFGDDGEPNHQAESFVNAGANRGIQPPFWIHAHRGKVLTVTPFSKDVGEDAWLKIIKNSVKE